jgi:hypothetical protein
LFQEEEQILLSSIREYKYREYEEQRRRQVVASVEEWKRENEED